MQIAKGEKDRLDAWVQAHQAVQIRTGHHLDLKELHSCVNTVGKMYEIKIIYYYYFK